MHQINQESLEKKCGLNLMMNHTELNSNSQIKFKILVLKSSLYDYSDAYILVNATITVLNTRANGTNPNNRKNVVIKNSAPFTNCISKINNTQIDNAKEIDIVMLMYILIECSDNYSKTSSKLWDYYSDEPYFKC